MVKNELKVSNLFEFILTFDRQNERKPIDSTKTSSSLCQKKTFLMEISS